MILSDEAAMMGKRNASWRAGYRSATAEITALREQLAVSQAETSAAYRVAAELVDETTKLETHTGAYIIEKILALATLPQSDALELIVAKAVLGDASAWASRVAMAAMGIDMKQETQEALAAARANLERLQFKIRAWQTQKGDHESTCGTKTVK